MFFAIKAVPCLGIFFHLWHRFKRLSLSLFLFFFHSGAQLLDMDLGFGFLAENIEEWVTQGFLSRNPLTGVLNKHLFNQFSALWTYHSEGVAEEIGLLVLDHLESLSFLLSREGKNLADHQVHNDAKRPHINLNVVWLL